MKIKICIFAAVTTLACALPSCRDEAPYVFNPYDQQVFIDWSDLFESYWNGMNYSYVFWDVDPTDWDQVYADYKPRFEGLEFNVAADSVKAVELFTELTSTLIDHHYGLIIKDETGGWYALISPSDAETKQRDYYHAKIDANQLFNNMLAWEESGRVTELSGTFNTEPGGFIFYTCLIDNSIVYLRLNSFELTTHLRYENVARALDQYYDFINELPDLKGIIIDTRSNGGGSTIDEHFILTPLLNEPHTFGYTRTKLGMGRLDYTPWIPLTLNPREDVEKEYVTRDVSNIPIVGLIDIHSLSMAEITPMAIQELPNGIIIGERSYGGHGPLNNDINAFYTGELENSAFRIYTSTSMTKRLDGKCYEGIGIIPDIEVFYNDEEFKHGNDLQLERAIQYIKTGH